MRVVIDTNIVISGLLWGGTPRRLIDAAIAERLGLYTSPALIEELAHTLTYRKFTNRLAQFDTTPGALAARYAALATVLTPRSVPAVIIADPDDDQVLACAVEARAHWIVSGDKHLHTLGGSYQGIRILRPAEAVAMMEAR